MKTLQEALDAWPEHITYAQIKSINEYLEHKNEAIRSILWYKIGDCVYVTLENDETIRVERDGNVEI